MILLNYQVLIPQPDPIQAPERDPPYLKKMNVITLNHSYPPLDLISQHYLTAHHFEEFILTFLDHLELKKISSALQTLLNRLPLI